MAVSEMEMAKVKGGGFLFSPLGSLPQFTPEEFDDEAREFIAAVKDFVEGELLANDKAIDEPNFDLSVELLKKAGELGLLSIEIPEEFEGLDLSKRINLAVVEEIARQASFSVSYSAHTGIGTLPILYFGSPEQKAKYLPKLGSGEWLAAYALTEANAGSDALGVRSTAVLDGEEWVLNGSKMFITNAGFADVFVVFAKINGKRLSAFIVEKDDPGFSLGAEEHKLGIKGSSTRALSLDNCRIPKDRLLGEAGKGHKIAFGILAIGRFKLGGSCIGGGKHVLKYTLKYTSERVQFGRSLNTFGLIRQKLADMASRIFVGEALSYRTIGYVDALLHETPWDSECAGPRKMEAWDEYVIEASSAKVWGSEALFLIADEAVQAFGGYGFSQEYPPEKIYRDCRINRIFEGTNEINRLLVGTNTVKRAFSNESPFAEFQELMATEGELKAGAGPMAHAEYAVELSRRQLAVILGLIQKLMGPKVVENQEAVARLADMVMELYAMESAVVRAKKMLESNHRWAEFAQDCAHLYVNEAWYRIQNNARHLAADLAEDAEMELCLERLDRYNGLKPLASSKLHVRIADCLIDRGDYPITLV